MPAERQREPVNKTESVVTNVEEKKRKEKESRGRQTWRYKQTEREAARERTLDLVSFFAAL